MITLLDFLKETLTDIVRANGLPMGLRKVVKGEAGIAIAAETSWPTGIGGIRRSASLQSKVRADASLPMSRNRLSGDPSPAHFSFALRAAMPSTPLRRSL